MQGTTRLENGVGATVFKLQRVTFETITYQKYDDSRSVIKTCQNSWGERWTCEQSVPSWSRRNRLYPPDLILK